MSPMSTNSRSHPTLRSLLRRTTAFGFGLLLAILLEAILSPDAQARTGCDDLVCSLSTYQCAVPHVPPLEPVDCKGGSDVGASCSETVYCN